MTKHLVLAAAIFAAVGCGSDAQHSISEAADESTEFPEVPDGLIDNGDGSFSIPESWLADVVEVDESAVIASDVIEKATDARSATGPTLFARNFTYTLTLPYGGGASGTITSVSYKWSLSYKPAGLVVLLCRNGTTDCADVTTFGTGNQFLWNNKTSNVPFTFAFRVNGAAGAVNPQALGQTDQVQINY